MKITLLILLICGLFFGLRKQVNYFYYRAFIKQKTMIENSNYIVQYVGFKTELDEQNFIKRWTPFASNFKNAGIKTIDLYRVKENDEQTYISRNIWDKKTYFENFPSGVAGSGSGGGIKVTQFGGYWIDDKELEKPENMTLLFTDDNSAISTSKIQRSQCTKNVKYLKMIEFLDSNQSSTSPKLLICNHLKTM